MALGSLVRWKLTCFESIPRGDHRESARADGRERRIRCRSVGQRRAAGAIGDNGAMPSAPHRPTTTLHTFSPAAVLFDCDGVLVDSHGAAAVAWNTWATTWAPSFDFDRDIVHGRRMADSVAELVGADGRAEAVRQLEHLELVTTDGIVPISGAPELLASLPSGYWVAVTSALRSLAIVRLEAAGLPLPTRFVTAEAVERGKPDPEPYIRGAELAGVPASACVVFEDAPAGIAAARAAGVGWVVGVGASALDTDAFGVAADVVVPDLSAVSFSDGTFTIDRTRTIGTTIGTTIDAANAPDAETGRDGTGHDA